MDVPDHAVEATNLVILLDDPEGINLGTVPDQLLKNENSQENWPQKIGISENCGGN